jgi:hypothetical protein
MIKSPEGIIWSLDNPYELFTFDKNHSLFVSNIKCNDTSFCLWYSSPFWQFNDSSSTKYAFMGEINKWTFISRQRFSSLNINSDNIQMTITVQGVPNESVHLLVYHSKFQSIIQIVCNLSNHNAQAQLIISPANVTCS